MNFFPWGLDLLLRSIFFLDEPTTGLDEVTAAQCVHLLRELAHQNHTVVCTIHQPSSAMFKLFDHIYVLAAGHCVYQVIYKCPEYKKLNRVTRI